MNQDRLQEELRELINELEEIETSLCIAKANARQLEKLIEEDD
jgi:hypothetical protein